jgi:RNA polymerase sigma factor (sigma-70 family)
MTKIDDQYYITKIVEGDKKAFAVLVDRYKDLVFTLALRMLKNREEAEEVAQDTFIKVFKSLSQFKGDSKFSTWIYRITYNGCLDSLKKYKQEYNNIPLDDYTGRQLMSLDNAVDAMEDQEQQQTIKECLQLLPKEDNFLLTLYYYEEQSLDEISKIMGITSNNAKVKLYRSRKKLTSILKERLEPEIIEHYERERK